MVFFTDSNGRNDATTANPRAHQYAPLQQLADDLADNNVADYNWITPNQFNDMHTGLTGGFKGLAGDAGQILQGVYLPKQIAPLVYASKPHKENREINKWFC